MTQKKYVYLFSEGNKEWRNLLGGKGANLAEMTNIGLPVPAGFTITTEACNEFYAHDWQVPAQVWDEVNVALEQVEKQSEKRFGEAANPLLVSVRSGAKFSMPGMMDTVLNLGLNDETAAGLTKLTDNERFVFDAYRRFIMMFSDIVLSGDVPALSRHKFERIFDAIKQDKHVQRDTDLDAKALHEVVDRYKAHFKEATGYDFPADPKEQLKMAVEAVFRSWMNDRAILYRQKYNIPSEWGTAVNVQAMVFGNMGSDSGTGVAFTRNPATGDPHIDGEYLVNAQGEDVVAGVRTPLPVSTLETEQPAIYQQFSTIARRLENHYRDMQDIEFTVERGKLYILQCRSGKRTGAAAVKIAVDMVGEGLISKAEAVNRVSPEQLEQLLHPRLVNTEKLPAIASGLNAAPGGAVGHIALDAETAIKMKEEGKAVILVRKETNPDDLGGMLAAAGVLTQLGGRTSHAALVARQYGIPTVCGCGALRIDMHSRLVNVDDHTLEEGDVISIDGTEGKVYHGSLHTEPARVTGNFGTFMEWVDEVRKMRVRANCDTPEQAREAVELGAEGIGLCRTEHMFLGDRVRLVQTMILAETEEARESALNKLKPLQQEDFVGIFREMGERPVTIRLIDPPLHEFLPSLEELLVETTELRVREQFGPAYDEKMRMLSKVRDLHEHNPMLGLRGVRLSIYFPGIVKMQTAAIIAAACQVKKEGLDVHPEIMIPLVGIDTELREVKKDLEAVAQKSMKEEGIEVDYMFGTMIEIPRATLTADEIAKDAEFFSFGTNDLTQLTYGMSRDDAIKFLPLYIEQKLMPADPTETIDRKGVGRLMRMCIEDAQKVKPNMKLGICGEHGGDPDSVHFCHELGLDYVSCSPRRIPVARLAAAQAASQGGAERDR